MADFRIRNDVGATVFALLSGLSLLFLTAWLFSPKEPNKEIQPIPDVDAAEFSRISEERNEALSSLTEESARRAELATELRSAREANLALREKLKQSSASSQELVALRERSAQLQTRVNTLGKKNDNLAAKLAAAGAGAATLAKLKSDKDALAKELADLKAKTAADSAGTDAMATKQAAIAKERDDLKKRVADLEKKSADQSKQLAEQEKACNDAKAKLQAEIDGLKKQLADKQAAKAPAPAAAPGAMTLPMLANDSSELKGRFSSLFTGLEKVEGGPEEREKAYAELKKDGKTNDIHLVPFDVGSAEIVSAEEETLKGLLADSGKDSFLVVGYASTDGDAESNRKLSSERASAVAQKVQELSGAPQDNIKAIYLGQTKRFNLKYLSPNRVVEVWRLKP